MSLIENIKNSLGFSEEEKKQFKPEESGIEDEEVIIPVPPYYEIIMIRPESMEDMDFVSNQIIDEKNPVIVDLSYLEEEGIDTFELAKEKIKFLRQEYDAESILISNSSDRSIILIAPSRIKIVK